MPSPKNSSTALVAASVAFATRLSRVSTLSASVESLVETYDLHPHSSAVPRSRVTSPGRSSSRPVQPSTTTTRPVDHGVWCRDNVASSGREPAPGLTRCQTLVRSANYRVYLAVAVDQPPARTTTRRRVGARAVRPHQPRPTIGRSVNVLHQVRLGDSADAEQLRAGTGRRSYEAPTAEDAS
jgi:hypothetical protein